MTAADTHGFHDARFEALCDAIANRCEGHPISMVRCALGALLAESFAQTPLADRTTELGYDLALIREYVRELPP